MAFKQLLTALSAALVAQAAITKRVACPDGKHTATNAALFAARDDIQKNMFEGGKCNDVAHEALRL